MLSLILTIVLAFLGFSALTYLFYCYEAIYTGHLRRLAGELRTSPAWLVIRGIVMGAAGQFFVVLTYPLGFASRAFNPGQPKPGPMVVMVHGLYHSSAAWVLFRYWFARAGLKNVYTYSYPSFVRDFDQITAWQTALVRELMARMPGREIVFVGHSLGGLVIRRMLDEADIAGRTSCLVTIGTPHRGSRLAVLGLGGLAKSLTPGSELMRSLAGQALPRGACALSISSPLDNLVLPPENLLPPRDPCWKTLATAPVTHLSHLYHWPTAKACLKFIKEKIGE